MKNSFLANIFMTKYFYIIEFWFGQQRGWSFIKFNLNKGTRMLRTVLGLWVCFINTVVSHFGRLWAYQKLKYDSKILSTHNQTTDLSFRHWNVTRVSYPINNIYFFVFYATTDKAKIKLLLNSSHSLFYGALVN